jgi:putative oxidoreductase
MADTWAPRVLSILRFFAGLLFFEHGLAKLTGFPQAVNWTRPYWLLVLAALIEAVGGALVCVGLYTRIAAFIMSGEMAFAYFMSHAPRNAFPLLNGGDAAILYCFVFLYLFVAGGGEWSLDRWWRKVPARARAIV